MRKWIVGVALLAVVLGGLFLMGYIPAEGFDGGLGVTFYDAEGNPVDLPLAYMRGGSEAEEMGVRITWSYTGANLEAATLATWGTLKIDLLEQDVNMRVKLNLASESWEGEPSLYSYWESTYVLDTLLPDEYKDEGWLIRASTTIYASIYDTYGNKLEDNILVQSSEFTIAWDELAGTFSVGGSITA